MKKKSHQTVSDTLKIGQDTPSYRDLMRDRVHEILVVASLYDAFKLEEDGRLTERIFAEYQEMSFSNAPHVSRVGTASQALKKIRENHYDLIISMPRISDMDPFEFGAQVKTFRPDLPILLLVSSTKESNHYTEMERLNPNTIDKIFFWSGDSAILSSIIKYSEDKQNAERDILQGKVQAIIVVEDSPWYYSSILPMLYREIANHTENIVKQGNKCAHRLLQVKSRPKILLATNYEEALAYFNTYQKSILAVISDAGYPRNGQMDELAGIRLLKAIQIKEGGIPLALHSRNIELKAEARKIGIQFFDKNSEFFLHDLREFVVTHSGFGKLVLHTANGGKSIVVEDLASLEEALDAASRDSLLSHARKNRFSNWLATRGYLACAAKVRTIRDVSNAEDIRKTLKNLFKEQVKERCKEPAVEFFSIDSFDRDTRLVRIGGGSLGGKAHGVTFIATLLKRFDWVSHFPGVSVEVPKTAFIGTEIYDTFIQTNHVRERFSSQLDDDVIDSVFLKSDFSSEFVDKISAYLSLHKKPLAVRSSSILEGSSMQPFAGVYRTFMIPPGMNADDRLKRVLEAIKLVYASTFHNRARAYMEMTGNRPGNEKMAVILMEIVGEQNEDYFYPTLSGTLQTYDFHPVKATSNEDGVAVVALGLGQTVDKGKSAFRFSPHHPEQLLPISLETTEFSKRQCGFYALDLESSKRDLTGEETDFLVQLPFALAQKHGVLGTFSSLCCSDKTSIDREITPKATVFIADILKDLMAFGREVMGCEVEIEFAVNLSQTGSLTPVFSILQIRPLTTQSQLPTHDPLPLEPDDLICESEVCAGVGMIDNVNDIILVKTDGFNVEMTPTIATEISELNAMFDEDQRYVLMGPGSWGSADHRAGIPVDWADISSVAAIVEIGLPEFGSEPPLGCRFFQNLASLGISYFVTSNSNCLSTINLSWLNSLPCELETTHLKWFHFEKPICLGTYGKNSNGYILKPGVPLQNIVPADHTVSTPFENQ